MEQLILIVHVLAALGIIGLILIQQGKGADMGASFGAGASQTLFGSAGSGNVLTKMTAILATVFFATSFGLAIEAKDRAVETGVIPLPELVESQSVTVEQEIPAENDQFIPGDEINSNSAVKGTSDDIPE